MLTEVSVGLLVIRLRNGNITDRGDGAANRSFMYLVGLLDQDL